ncbi:MAG TPA: nucleotide exchange factor GrpE [Chitinophagaceae bacterium]|jgi:molecular chaperone GrpE|nr:nucleotide exchange factor GrpE [Chitinophagaceae bacterium]
MDTQNFQAGQNSEPLDFSAEGLELNTDESVNGSQHLNEPVEDDNESDKLRAKIEELNDKYLRQAAEFDNFRRRSAKERIEQMQTAGREVITSLLDVLDDSERAQKQLEATDDVAQIKEGVQLVFTKLRSTLMGKGLKPMEAIGQEFNADLHEAITDLDAGEKMKGKVVDEVMKGYYLNDKIIRYAKVVVGK